MKIAEILHRYPHFAGVPEKAAAEIGVEIQKTIEEIVPETFPEFWDSEIAAVNKYRKELLRRLK